MRSSQHRRSHIERRGPIKKTQQEKLTSSALGDAPWWHILLLEFRLRLCYQGRLPLVFPVDLSFVALRVQGGLAVKAIGDTGDQRAVPKHLE